jgi:hypothetical protein
MLMIRQTPMQATSVTQAKDRGKLLSLPVRISIQQKSDFQMVDRECDGLRPAKEPAKAK